MADQATKDMFLDDMTPAAIHSEALRSNNLPVREVILAHRKAFNIGTNKGKGNGRYTRITLPPMTNETSVQVLGCHLQAAWLEEKSKPWYRIVHLFGLWKPKVLIGKIMTTCDLDVEGAAVPDRFDVIELQENATLSNGVTDPTLLRNEGRIAGRYDAVLVGSREHKTLVLARGLRQRIFLCYVAAGVVVGVACGVVAGVCSGHDGIGFGVGSAILAVLETGLGVVHRQSH